MKRRASLGDLGARTFRYFWDLANPTNGLIPDNTKSTAPASIAATGFGLACLPVAVEAGWISRQEAAARARLTLQTFWNGPQGHHPAAIGHRGFFYHFLDMGTARRVWKSELSTIDSTFLLAGALTAGLYFDRARGFEAEIRQLSEDLYTRADWIWALNGDRAVAHGWKPESGFLQARWQGYNEATLLYALALGSPNPIPSSAYDAWVETYRWKKLYDLEHLFGGPLFVHQLSHLWIDFRGIQDRFMQRQGIDYFENSRRATLVQQRYAMRNPRAFNGYGEYVWGISASDGPGPATLTVDGRPRTFWDYRARGVPWGPDDGTLTPWAVAASLPFAPDLVIDTLAEIDRRYPEMNSELGYKCSFNPTFREAKNSKGWVSSGYYGLDQGPVVLMIANHETEMIWELMRRSPFLVNGLARAGFQGGWLPRA